MAAFDRWGGSWGASWGLSWTRETVAPPVVVETPATGGHYWPNVETRDWRTESAKKRREFLERLLGLVEDAPEEVQEEAKEAIGVPEDAPLAVPKRAPSVAQIERLTRVVQDYLDDEEETLFLLMVA